MARTQLCLAIGLTLTVLSSEGVAEMTLTLKQDRDGGPAINLTSAELAALGDPFFLLVLREHADETSLLRIEELIQPDPHFRRVFVVDENIRNRQRPAVRRAVMTFSGSNRSIVLEPNVMLSVFFSSDDFPDQPTAIEALGWDDLRGRYNYYKMDGSGTPTLQKTWKLRSSSIDADLLSATDRSNTCLACHINGAPIMKELVFPWNNWHSDASGSPAQYLSGPDAWPVADHRRLRNSGGGSGLADAQELEQMIIPSIRNFNTRRLNQALERRSDDGNIRLRDGRMRIVDGRRLLRHLFHTTEVNLISARRKSGLHPIGEALTSGPSTEVIIPNSFFLNAALITGGGIHGYQGLQIPEANAFEFFAKIQPQEYIALVRDRGLIIAGRPGDADFAWFGVEPSHIDNEMVDRLLRRGVMTPQFVAAALTIDLESPVFSDRRAALFRFMPDAWEFRDPLVETTSHPDELTQLVISRLEAEAPSEGTPEREYLTLLKAPDPVAILREKVIAYADRIQTQLASGGSVREAEVARLFDILIARRRQMLDPKEPLNVLDETRDRLFPHQP